MLSCHDALVWTAVVHLPHASLVSMAHLNSSAQCTLHHHAHIAKSAMKHPGPTLLCAMRHASCVGSIGRGGVMPHQYSLGSSAAQLAFQVAQPVCARHARATRAKVKVVLTQQATLLAPQTHNAADWNRWPTSRKQAQYKQTLLVK